MPHHPGAWLHAQGDETAAAVDGMPGPDAQRALRALLAAFPGHAAGIVGRHAGLLVSAEGDVLVATLPLHTAVPCARELAERYEAALQPFVDRRWHATPERPERPRTCLSVGLSFSGSGARSGRQEAERATARAAERGNSLAIVATGARAELSLLREWNDPSPPDLRLKAWLSLMRAGYPLDGTAVALDGLAGAHAGVGAGREELRALREVLRASLESGRPGQGLPAADIDVLLEPFELGALPEGVSAELRSLSQELQLAQMIHDERRGASGQPARSYSDANTQTWHRQGRASIPDG